jgi:hypothetical protein
MIHRDVQIKVKTNNSFTTIGKLLQKYIYGTRRLNDLGEIQGAMKEFLSDNLTLKPEK